MGAPPPAKRDKAGADKATVSPARTRAASRITGAGAGGGRPKAAAATKAVPAARPPPPRRPAAGGPPAARPPRRVGRPAATVASAEDEEDVFDDGATPSSGTASPVVTDSDEDVPAPGAAPPTSSDDGDGSPSASGSSDADDESSDSEDLDAAAAAWGTDEEGDGGDATAAAARFGGAWGGGPAPRTPGDGTPSADLPPLPLHPPRAGSPGDDDDSSDGGRPNINTAGDVPLEWYRAEGHVGYDLEGGRLDRKGRGWDKLDGVLARADSGKALRTIYDEYNDEEITLSKEELKMVKAIRSGRFPHVGVEAFEPEADWFSRDVSIHPLNAAPEPKRRFMPSKWEERAVVRLVRALRRGWIKPRAEREATATAAAGGEDGGPDSLLAATGPLYMLWGDDGLGDPASHTAAGLSYVPAPKPRLPGHEESYNPPPEYLPREGEDVGNGEGGEDGALIPKAFPNLRAVPAYAAFVKDRFERCLDLYLCPRARKKQAWVEDAASLLPDLPKPADLRPYPRRLASRLSVGGGKGDAAATLRGLAVDPAGQWVAAGGDGGVVTVWEVATGRAAGRFDAAAAAGVPKGKAGLAERRVSSLAWRPGPAGKAAPLLAIAVGQAVVIAVPPPGIGTEAQAEAGRAAVEGALAAAAAAAGPPSAAEWKPATSASSSCPALRIDGGAATAHVAWHGAGDYLVSTAPAAPGARAVAVHRLSGGRTQTPFRKLKGRAALAAFHPTRPALLVSAGAHVRVYDLAAQALASKLVGGSGGATALGVHPRGDHVLLGSADSRLAWYDLDLGATPYRALRYHKGPLTGAAFHPTYPLFASVAADGAAHVFHGTVYADLMTPPLIVPLKVLAGAHGPARSGEGATALAWHPHQPWLFTTGVGGEVCMWVDDA